MCGAYWTCFSETLDQCLTVFDQSSMRYKSVYVVCGSTVSLIWFGVDETSDQY